MRHRVGSNANQGSAYVFVRNVGVWTLQGILSASNGAADDQFGRSVAIDANVAVIGTPGDQFASSIPGSAYVFVRNGGVWSQQQQLAYSNGSPSDRFGWSVAIDGDDIVVGAWNVTVDGNLAQGTAYAFTFDAGVWALQSTLSASDGGAGDAFGTSVATSTGYAVVGAPTQTGKNGSFQGAAFVYDIP